MCVCVLGGTLNISLSRSCYSYILIMLKFGFQDLTSGSENDRNDSISQPSNQSDEGKQGLGPLSTPNPVHSAVKVRMASLRALPESSLTEPALSRH